MSTAVRWITGGGGQRSWQGPSLKKNELNWMNRRLRARFSKKQIRGFDIFPRPIGAVIRMIPGNKFLEHYLPQDVTSREGIAEMVARAITPRLWRFDHHVWLDETGKQALFGELEKLGLVSRKGRNLSSAWFLELHLRPKKIIYRGRFIFDPKIDPKAQNSVSLNYGTWYIPVRKDDLDKDGNLIPGKGKEILRRHTLSDLAPLFMARPVTRHELERKVRSNDIRAAAADPDVFQIIGEQRLRSVRDGKRPKVSLTAILNDAGVAPRISIKIDRFVGLLIGLDPEAQSSFYNIWLASSLESKLPLLQFAKMNDIYRAARGRIYSLRPMQLLALMLNDASKVKYIISDWCASEITTAGPLIFGEGGAKVRGQWLSAVSGKGHAGVSKAYESLSVIDILLVARWAKETHPDFYKSNMFPDLTGRRNIALA